MGKVAGPGSDQEGAAQAVMDRGLAQALSADRVRFDEQDLHGR